MSGFLFLGASDTLSLGILIYVYSRRKEFPANEPSIFYYALAGAAFLFSFPFRAAIAQNFLLDALWSWGACLEPLAVVPHCVALAAVLKDSDAQTFPVFAGLAKLIAAISAVVYWLYVTEARRLEYRRVSGLLLLLQAVGVCGSACLAALALKAEVARRKWGDKPLLTLVTKSESAKAL